MTGKFTFDFMVLQLFFFSFLRTTYHSYFKLNMILCHNMHVSVPALVRIFDILSHGLISEFVAVENLENVFAFATFYQRMAVFLLAGYISFCFNQIFMKLFLLHLMNLGVIFPCATK